MKTNIIRTWSIVGFILIALFNFAFFFLTAEDAEVGRSSRVRLLATPWTVAYQAPPSMGFSRQNTGVGCHFLLQEIFLTQGLNPGLPHCRQILYHLSH